MNRRLVLCTIALASLTPFRLGAHDPSQHKGKAITGEIVSLAEDRFELKTAGGRASVTFTSKTKFEHEGRPAGKSHLGRGERVSVIGTRLPTGEIVAREVLMGAAPKSAQAQRAREAAPKK